MHCKNKTEELRVEGCRKWSGYEVSGCVGVLWRHLVNATVQTDCCRVVSGWRVDTVLLLLRLVMVITSPHSRRYTVCMSHRASVTRNEYLSTSNSIRLFIGPIPKPEGPLFSAEFVCLCVCL